MKTFECKYCGCTFYYDEDTEKPQLCEECEFSLYEEDNEYDF